MQSYRAALWQTLLVFLVFCSPTARGQDCVDYSATMKVGAQIAAPDTISQTALWQGHLVTAGGNSLTLHSLADPLLPAATATVTLPGAFADLALGDQVAVVGLAGDGFVVVDLAGPTLLAPPVAASAHAVAVSGAQAAIASATGLIQMFDLSTPAVPALLGSLDLGHPVSDLAFGAGIVYAGGDEGLFCIGVTDPEAPTLVGSLVVGHDGSAYPNIAPHFTNLALAGNQLTVLGVQHNEWCDEWSCYPGQDPQLFTIDVSAPDAPLYVAWRELQGNSVRLWNGLVLVADSVQLTIVDGASLATLARLSVEPSLGDAVGGDAAIYAARGTGGLQVIDAAHPRTILPVATCGLAEEWIAGAGGRFTLRASDNSNGRWRSIIYSLYDLQDPLNPVVVEHGSRGGMNTNPGVTFFDAQGDLAVFGAVTDGWYYPYTATLGDYTHDPAEHVFLGYADQVLLDGTIAWVRLGTTLTAKSFADFANPVDVASLTLPGISLYRMGDVTTVLAAGNLHVLDLTDPAAPAVRGSIPILSYRRISAAMPDSFLVLGMGQTDDGYTLGIIDVGDPDHPAWASQVAGEGQLAGLGLMGDVLLVFNETGLRTLSVADPANPVWLSPELALVRPQGTPVIHGDLAYVNTFNIGLAVVDLTDPSRPFVRGTAGGPTQYMRGWQQSILTGDAVFPLDCSDAVPALVQSLGVDWDGGALRLDLRLAGSADDLRLVNRGPNGDRVIPWLDSSAGSLAARDTEWQGTPGSTLTYVVQLQTAAEVWVDLATTTTEVPGFTLRLEQAVPNPFNPTTTLAFTLDRPGQVALTIYSVAGEKIRTLVDEQMGTGLHQAVWDGANDHGRMVAAGVYLARLQADGRQVVSKMALIK